MKFVLPFLFCFILLGCSMKQMVIDERVSFIDAGWNSHLRLTNVLSTVSDDGHLRVQVTGFNDGSSYQKLQYRIQWLNKSGLFIPTILTRWVDFPAFQNSPFNFQEIAPSTKATSFQILIRENVL
ncbi:MAG TPA: DUF1425 domain-containing protein [Methylococcaceae bacterium]|jgi:uncharacterized protein YcfL|nr:DUF1425 domain-containing protein [Methylococcaceae bacterium]HIA45947.1 DUF1425 domain-containing protein [Methylococcaceae bacterium]HIB63341.1 DUF1425 domain-containing protein [Methylococcaceae bacterium]HIN68517.1 DUF1425 domain-containing protein [Methylococcales bacterium]HIO23061.1 DUF1425 domain-containing protein [Nitrospinaceae bacterium]